MVHTHKLLHKVGGWAGVCVRVSVCACAWATAWDGSPTCPSKALQTKGLTDKAKSVLDVHT